MSFQVSLENLSHQFRRTQKALSRELSSLQSHVAQTENWASDVQRIQSLLHLLEVSSQQEKSALLSLEARLGDSSAGDNVWTLSLHRDKIVGHSSLLRRQLVGDDRSDTLTERVRLLLKDIFLSFQTLCCS